MFSISLTPPAFPSSRGGVPLRDGGRQYRILRRFSVGESDGGQEGFGRKTSEARRKRREGRRRPAFPQFAKCTLISSLEMISYTYCSCPTFLGHTLYTIFHNRAECGGTVVDRTAEDNYDDNIDNKDINMITYIYTNMMKMYDPSRCLRWVAFS